MEAGAGPRRDVLRVAMTVVAENLCQRESVGTVFQIRFLRASALVVAVTARAPGAVEGAAVASRGFGSPRIRRWSVSSGTIAFLCEYPRMLGDVALAMPMGPMIFCAESEPEYLPIFCCRDT